MTIEDEIRSTTEHALGRVESASTTSELDELKRETLGRHGGLAALNKDIGRLPPDERKAAGLVANEARNRIEDALLARRRMLEGQERARRLEAERLDLTEVLPAPGRGHLHLVTQTRQALEDVFVGMGFEVAEGPEVETDWYNFEGLNFALGHPARAMHDTFYVDIGRPENTVLRTHTSPMQLRLMEVRSPPIYAVIPGRCYRRDTADARHLPVFHQIEGLVIDHGITFGDLAGTIEAFTTAYFGPGIHSRLRPAFFPFTEPSAEFEVTCIFCEGAGCRVCSNVGWIELGGAGMVHPNVLHNGGIDPEEWSGFAFGFGIDRLAMTRYQIDDLRHFITNDLRFLEQF